MRHSGLLPDTRAGGGWVRCAADVGWRVESFACRHSLPCTRGRQHEPPSHVSPHLPVDLATRLAGSFGGLPNTSHDREAWRWQHHALGSPENGSQHHAAAKQDSERASPGDTKEGPSIRILCHGNACAQTLQQGAHAAKYMKL